MDLFDTLMPLVESTNMDWYFRQLQQEVRDNCRTRSPKGNMRVTLESHRPRSGQLLLVNAETGMERKAIHVWAGDNGYRSESAKTNYFEPVTIFHCYECKKNFYGSEMSRREDFLFVVLGWSFGVTIQCPDCGVFYYPDDDDDDLDVKRKGSCFNTVIIGRELPQMSKKISRKHSKRVPKPNDQDRRLVDELEEREIKVLSLTEFESEHK